MKGKKKRVTVLKIVKDLYKTEDGWCLEIIWGSNGSTDKATIVSDDKRFLDQISQGDEVLI